MFKTTIIDSKRAEACSAVQNAIISGDEKAMQEAWEGFYTSIAEEIKQEYLEADGDEKILAQRGFRQLTSDETKFYQNIIKAGKDGNPKQALSSLIDANAMPETIIEDVYKNLVDEHPLLSKIKFTSVKYLTRVVLNDHTVDTAIWGAVNSEITKKIDSSFRSLSIVQNKLSAYAVIDKDMLDLGPAYLDSYVRTVLKDALACGLEKAAVSGNGLNCPIGLDRDIHQGVSVSSSTGYPAKTAVKLASFSPKDYGAVLSTLAKTEVYYATSDGTICTKSTSGAIKHGGKDRKFTAVTLVCNMVDYLQTIMPASTVMTPSGTFAKNVFPFPTEVIISNEVASGKAIVFLPEEYNMYIGASKEGNIEYSDDFKFLEDIRTFKIKMYGAGQAFDNTCSILLDISGLEPAYVTVKDMAGTVTATE